MSETPQVTPSRPVATQPSVQPQQPAGTQVAPAAESVFDLPKTVEATIACILELDVSAEMVTSTNSWRMGRPMKHLREGFGYRYPARLVATHVGLKEGALYTMARVMQAFTYEELCHLTRLGVPWVTLRVLASDRLTAHRKSLVALYEDGHLSLIGLHRLAVSIRAAGTRSGRRRTSR